jgi:hypothetical protein
MLKGRRRREILENLDFSARDTACERGYIGALPEGNAASR